MAAVPTRSLSFETFFYRLADMRMGSPQNQIGTGLAADPE
jgi:hypothetical protein